MRGLRHLLFPATVLICVGTFAPAVAAQEAPPLAFADEKLETNCADLAAGKELAIVNATATVQPLNLLLSPSNAAGGEVAEACGGLSFAGAPQSVPAGGSVTVTLRAKEDTDPDEAITVAVVAFGDAAGRLGFGH